MPAEGNEKGWVLHSHGQGRRFGPLTDDELRSYFRAGMVKSVDRLSAPGEFVKMSASEAAAMLGEAAPVGPPPPEPNEVAAVPPPAVPPPVMSAVAAPGQGSDEERAARAAAAMNIDIAAMMAANAPPKRSSSGWLLPVVAVAGLVAMLMIGLNMMKRMQGAGAGPTSTQVIDIEPTPTELDQAGTGPGGTAGLEGMREIPPPQAATAAPASPEADEAAAQLQVRSSRAEQLRAAGDWAGLAAHAKAWADAEPSASEPLQYLGIAYGKLGNHGQAEEALKKVLARDATNSAARAQLADIYQQGQRYDEAATLYKQMVAANPNDSRLWNNYGAALFGSGQREQAAAALETAVRLDPKFKEAWNNLGTLYQSTGDSARASAAFANAR